MPSPSKRAVRIVAMLLMLSGTLTCVLALLTGVYDVLLSTAVVEFALGAVAVWRYARMEEAEGKQTPDA